MARPACPTCGKPQDAAFRPFCSKRCADVDLARWFRGDYAFPTDDPPGFEEGDGEGDGRPET